MSQYDILLCLHGQYRNMWPHLIIIAIASFLIGAIPFGLLISKGIARIDITQRGSGNIGATNVARELGLKWGLLTLLLDLLKGFIPVYIFNHWFRSGPEASIFIICVSTLLGHQFSPFLGFRGGKGVATALGVFLALSPILVIPALLLFIITVSITDYISLGSMVAACSMPFILILSDNSAGQVSASLAMAALICIRHRDNIRRLLKGEERQWRKKGQVRSSRSRSNSSSE